jgi:hypothetical protein
MLLFTAQSSRDWVTVNLSRAQHAMLTRRLATDVANRRLYDLLSRLRFAPNQTHLLVQITAQEFADLQAIAAQIVA